VGSVVRPRVDRLGRATEAVGHLILPHAEQAGQLPEPGAVIAVVDRGRQRIPRGGIHRKREVEDSHGLFLPSGAKIEHVATRL
jgi:hypothetical protein